MRPVITARLCHARAAIRGVGDARRTANGCDSKLEMRKRPRIRSSHGDASIVVESPIARTASTTAMHLGGKRKISDVYGSLKWVGFSGAIPDWLCLIDDVITCGTTFKACKRLIAENCPEVKVCG